MTGMSGPVRTEPPPAKPVTFLVAVLAIEVFGLAGFGRWGWTIGNGGASGTLTAIGMTMCAAAI